MTNWERLDELTDKRMELLKLVQDAKGTDKYDELCTQIAELQNEEQKLIEYMVNYS